MTKDEDYRRLSIYMDKPTQKERIRTEFKGRDWEQLTRAEKTKTIQDMIYQGFYPHSSEKLSRGIDYIRGNTEEFKHGTIKRKNKTHNVIRDAKGKIFRWLD